MKAGVGHVLDETGVWQALDELHDPEIPVLSLVEMKIVRNVVIEDDSVKVEITPTFVGCPALEFIKDQIRAKMLERGFKDVEVKVNHSLPWSTDMLDHRVREKIRKFGIAPPPRVEVELSTALSAPVECPFCGSADTHLDSPFGPTLCKQIFYCDSCRQSFERFKPL